MQTPVVLLIFNRPDTTRRVLEVVRAVQPSTLLVVADGPRPHVPSDAERCAETRTLIDEIEAGGAPDIDDGEGFQADLIEKFEDFHTAIDTARAEAEAASTADPVAFQSTISDLIATFQTETQTVGNSFSELDAKYGDVALDSAVRDACSFM